MKHRFDTGKSKTGYEQQTFVIEVDVLNKTNLKALPEYLIKNIHLVFDANKTVTKDTMWPVTVDIKGQLNISEEILWSMVCDSLPNAKALVIEYIKTLCNLAKQTKYGDLLYNDEYNFAGSFALKPFFNWYLEQEESRAIESLPVYECFIEFIRRCDLGFETFQDDYIEKVLRKLVYVNEDKSVELLCLRLNNGQLADKDFRYLHHFLGYSAKYPGRLKKVIDYLIDSDSDDIRKNYRNSEATYLQLCAAIYGDNLKETQEIMDYVRQKNESTLRAVRPHQINTIQRIRIECEAFRASQPPTEDFLNSSFHVYDQKNKRWLPLGKQMNTL
jgi:hypothetical protein